jgi:hypothetical protein
LEEINNTLREGFQKIMFKFLYYEEDERLERVLIVRFWIKYLNLELMDFVNGYFDFALEDLAMAEKKSFLERLNKMRKYEEMIRKIFAYSLVLNDGMNISAAQICLNYLENNIGDPSRKCVMIGLVYYLIWEEPDNPRLQMRVLSLANQMIVSVLNEKSIDGVDTLDPICILLIIFECHSYIVKIITETVNTSRKYEIWPALLRNLDMEWGSILLQRSFKLGNLASIEPLLNDMPSNLGFLLYYKAKKYINLLFLKTPYTDPRLTLGWSIMKKLDQIGDYLNENPHLREDFEVNLSLIGKQMFEAFRFFNYVKKENFAQKALKFSKKLFSIIRIVETQESSSLRVSEF